MDNATPTKPPPPPAVFSGAVIRSYAEQGRVPPRIGIVSVGIGNINSIANAMTILGAEVEECPGPDGLPRFDGVVLPGVGAFPAAMRRLCETGIIEGLAETVARGVPLLGICLGMQLLTRSSDEFEATQGLGFVPGDTRAMDCPLLPLPHVGWNDVALCGPSPMYAGIPDGTHFYFDHSYSVSCEPGFASARASYDVTFVASICAGPIWGTQFHPEKSQLWGLRLIRNFLDYAMETRDAC